MDKQLIDNLFKAVDSIEDYERTISYSKVGGGFDPETIEIPTHLWHNLVQATSDIQTAREAEKGL